MNSFIKKLVQEEKIKLTEPSDEISESYTKKAEKSLISAKTLIKINNFDDATALSYYSMYYTTLALIYKTGIKSENHTGTILLLKELFNIENKEIQQAKKERVDKQYYVEFKATKQEVKEGIQIAEEFNSTIKEKIDNIKLTEIEEIREEFKEKYF
jgi:uncharacterized protein (UPF0332 family)